jgi:hypothetical protein
MREAEGVVQSATIPEDRMTEWEEQRAAELREAQSKAQKLFDEIEAQGLIRAGISESRLNADIYALAEKMYGIFTYWHKRIVRAGKNTLLPYAEIHPTSLSAKTISSSSISVQYSRSGKRISAAPLFSGLIP